MIVDLLGLTENPLIGVIGVLLAFFLTALVLKFGMHKLPKDGGRQFAHDGILSKGKPRGAGLLFVLTFTAVSLIVVPFRPEHAIYLALTIGAMLTGYLDDEAQTPWGPLKKGLLDFAIALVTALTYVNFNGTVIQMGALGGEIKIPAIVFIVLGTALVWVSINVTNCTDGVDGLSGTLSVITLLSFYAVGVVIPVDAGFRSMTLLLVFVLAAYLWFNATPSVLLMGDAGSRAIGLLLAVVALKSGNPFLYIPLAIMLIFDGGAGLIKLSFGRFLKIKIMKNIRTPIHDHCRKNKGWSNTQVVIRFAIIQGLVSFAMIHLVK